jgi:hypothetical protein
LRRCRTGERAEQQEQDRLHSALLMGNEYPFWRSRARFARVPGALPAGCWATDTEIRRKEVPGAD